MWYMLTLQKCRNKIVKFQLLGIKEYVYLLNTDPSSFRGCKEPLFRLQPKDNNTMPQFTHLLIPSSTTSNSRGVQVLQVIDNRMITIWGL